MPAFDQDRLIAEDREDLLELLRMRFDDIPQSVIDDINSICSLDTIQRLILVAANAADWRIFAEELQSGEGSFKLTGERFQPIVEGGGRA